jgi:general secretion pathway protein E
VKSDIVDNLDISQVENYTVPESSGVGGIMQQTKIGPELKTRIREYLQAQGYEVTEEAELVGKSKVAHIFDMLAQTDDGFNSYTIAVCITSGGDKEMEVQTIFNFANKAYDCGITDRVLIAAPELSQQAKQLARKQRIKVIDGELVERLLASQARAAGQTRSRSSLRQRRNWSNLWPTSVIACRRRPSQRASRELNIPLIYWLIADTGQVGHVVGIDFLSVDRKK